MKHGAGNSNSGNTARSFFKHSTETADILNVPVRVVTLFHELLCMLNNPYKAVNEEIYGSKACELYNYLTLPLFGFNIAPMSTSVHRMLCHGLDFIRAFIEPLGMLSESSIEARNKYNRQYRAHFAFQGTLSRNVLDTSVRMLLTSDPYIFMKRLGKKISV